MPANAKLSNDSTPHSARISQVKHTFLATAALTVGALVTACSGSDTSAKETVTVTVEKTVGADTPASTPAESTSTSAERSDTKRIRQPATAGGITITVTKASSPDTYPVMIGSYQKNSGYDEYEATPPREGGKLIRIDAIVKNDTGQSIDITCSGPITAKVTDGKSLYDPVDSLHKIQGTPECNEDLNPGFSSKMTWVFEVPVDVKIHRFAFSDNNSASNPNNEIMGVNFTPL